MYIEQIVDIKEGACGMKRRGKWREKGKNP